MPVERVRRIITMEPSLTADIRDAHDSAIALIRTIPNAALDWQPGSDAWSLKQIIGHLAHANDFYVMIVGEVRATRFGTVHLHPDLAGWQQMLATDAAVAACTTTLTALDCFERTYRGMLDVLDTLRPEEIEQPFVFRRPGDEPLPTTLRQRVILMAAEHLREHQPHLSDMLARWQTAQAMVQTQESSGSA
jgi:DinB superfamily